ncbi:MAG: prepilin-type N-terminal cleavage/methylation domain-containing protein [Planctomycetaceae bacterium]|jgi:prepilin-type N-terminal cleavage/methylation domain-containing protein|nr:prepilin-type N-terminal cleavage/methylation domain-containing protein [Planctomycetaceae bacterium]
MKILQYDFRKSACRTMRCRPSGLTLVELLVVVSIMSILLAVSVPAIRPMLETQKTRNAADTVSTFLSQARLRAMETGLPCGVRFERYTGLQFQEGTGVVVYMYNGACLQMRQVAVPRPYGGCTEVSRLSVNNTGVITLDSMESVFWGENDNCIVRSGDQIQFDYQGPRYGLAISGTSVSINWQQFDPASPGKNLTQVPFKVYRQPRPTLAAPVRFPQGVVIDLNASGSTDEFAALNENDLKHVTIMFLPNGEVDYVDSSIGGKNTDNNPIFLCVGLWDRMKVWIKDSTNDYNLSTDYLPEETPPRLNYEDLNNFWVTVFPKTGAITVQPVAAPNAGGTPPTPLEALEASRAHAKDIQAIGGR